MATDSIEDVRPPKTVTPVAVIDVGTTSIRMAIAEIDDEGGVRTLETLSQAVALGKDTFTRGFIERETIEACVRVLERYRRVLEEYQIVRPEQIRAVATSAVREATNRLAFLDRLYIATGISVEPVDEAEVSRITFLGVQPFLRDEPELSAARAIVCEVGGGSTEVLIVESGDVVFSQTIRLGSLRVRETLARYHLPEADLRSMMETQIRRTIEQLAQQIGSDGPIELIALGGDVRFAAAQLLPGREPGHLARLALEPFERFTDSILDTNEDKLVKKYHLAAPDAATLGTALLTYLEMGRVFNLKQIFVTDVNLRDGLLQEMAVKGAWTEDFYNQILRSATILGRKFDFSEDHARHVSDLCRMLFRGLQEEHQLEPRYELLLCTAALLHEIGQYISVGSYHKHTMYLILNSELFGLSKKDLLLVALIARYHRRASPKPTHQGYATLDRDQRVTVVKLAALLRVADALDSSRSQRVQQLEFSRERGRLVISIPNVEDLSLERLALKQTGALFQETYGSPVLLRRLKR